MPETPAVNLPRNRTPEHTIFVQDLLSNPLPGTTLYTAVPTDRFVRTADATGLAVADADGRLVIDPAVVRETESPERVLLLFKDGMQPLRLERTPPHESIVRLCVTNTVSGVCVDTDGNPVAAALVRCSRLPTTSGLIDPADDSTDYLPGPDPDLSIHVARSDEHGRFAITGPESGRYGLYVEHPTHAPVDGDFQIEAPASGLRIELGRMYGVAVSAPSPSKTLLSHARLAPSRTPFMSREACRAAATKLRERLEADLAVVAVASADNEVPRARVGTLLTHFGWVAQELPLRPIERARIEVLRTGTPEPPAQVKVELIDLRGQVVPMQSLPMVWGREGRNERIDFVMPLNRVVEVPAGEIALMESPFERRGLLSRAIPEEIYPITPGSLHHLRVPLEDEVAAVQLRVTGVAARLDVSCWLSLRLRNGAKRTLVDWRDRSKPMWIAPGSLRVRAHAGSGFEPFERSITIERSSSYEPRVIDLDFELVGS